MEDKSEGFALLAAAAQRLSEDVLSLLRCTSSILISCLQVMSHFCTFLSDMLYFVSNIVSSVTFTLDFCCRSAQLLVIDLPLLASSIFVDFIRNNYIYPFILSLVELGEFLFTSLFESFLIFNEISIILIEGIYNAFLSFYYNGNLALSLCLFSVCLMFGGTIFELAFLSCRNLSMKLGRSSLKSNNTRSDTSQLSFVSEVFSSEQQKTCCVCLTEERSIVILPCTHFCLCSQCIVTLTASSSSETQPLCPVCRSQIREFMPIISS